MIDNNNTTLPSYSSCTNDRLKEVYGHGDCAAFADILNWDFEDKGYSSKIIMAGSGLSNHFYVKLESEKDNYVYCDVYGVFENEIDILNRYDLAKTDTGEVRNPEENDFFQTLIKSSDLFSSLEETEDKNEIFFLEMQKILKFWEESLVIIKKSKSKVVTIKSANNNLK